MAKELAQSPVNITLMIIQLMTFKKMNLRKTKRTEKGKKTWFGRISRKSGFCWRVGGGCEIKKNKGKEGCQETFHNELLEIQKQQLKLLEKSEKQCQAFQSKMLEKQLQSEAVEKQKDREFFLQFGKMLGQGNKN